MGLFGGKTKVHTATSVSRVIDDDMLPNSVTTGVVKSIFDQQEDQMSNYVLEEVSQSIGLKAARMYNFAKKDSIYGVPSKSFVNRAAKTEEIEVILKNLYGPKVVLKYSYLSSPNILHFAWEQLINNFGYDTKTNELKGASTSAGKAYLDSIRIVLPKELEDTYSDSATEQWGVSASAGYKPWEPVNSKLSSLVSDVVVGTSKVSIEDFVQVTYGVMTTTSKGSLVTKTTFSLKLPTTNQTDDYYQVCFELNGQRKYWNYKQGTGTYPSLDAVADKEDVLGTFYPIIHFRDNYTGTDSEFNSPKHKYNKKLAKYLGLNFDSMSEEINENPDVKDVIQSVMMFAVPANSKDKHDHRYLFEFFEEIFLSEGEGTEQPIFSTLSLFRRAKLAPKNAIVIQDSTFKCSLSYAGINRIRKVGNIGPIGYYDGGFRQDQGTVDRVDVETGQSYKQTYSRPTHYYRKQIDDDLYDVVEVVGLTMTYYMGGGYSTISDTTGANVLVPLDKSIVERFSIPDREVLVARSLQIIFNSMVIQKLKWYETGIFKAVLVVVSIAITIFSAGAGVFTTALAAGGTVALAAIWSSVIVPMLYGIAIQAASKLFVKVLGEEFAILLAVVALVYGYSKLIDGKSLFADSLIKVGNGLINEAQASFVQKTQDVYEELAEFNQYSSDMYEQLEAASKELLGDNLLRQAPYIVLGEPPATYFNRTVHSGNIGIQSIAAVSNYVDVALKLPSFNDTIEGIYYG